MYSGLNPEPDSYSQVTIIDSNIPSVVDADIISKKCYFIYIAASAYCRHVINVQFDVVGSCISLYVGIKITSINKRACDVVESTFSLRSDRCCRCCFTLLLLILVT